MVPSSVVQAVVVVGIVDLPPYVCRHPGRPGRPSRPAPRPLGSSSTSGGASAWAQRRAATGPGFHFAPESGRQGACAPSRAGPPLTGSSCMPDSPSMRPRPWPVIWPTWESVTSIARPPCRQRPAARMATTCVDPGRLNQELGGAAGYDRLVASLAEAGLGQLLDIVPNHMAVDGRANTWWWDMRRKRTVEPVRVLLRHRLDPAAAQAHRGCPHPRSRRPLRPGAGGGRVAHPVPPGLLQRPVPRAARRPCRPGASTI